LVAHCGIMSKIELETFNITVKHIDVIHEGSQIVFFRQQYATWANKFQVSFTEMRTKYGMVYTFNLVDSKKLLNYKV
jgi:hypothetical protein